MKGFTALILGIFGTLAFSWIGLAFIPNLQIGHLDPQTDEEGKDAYPAPKSGMAERGHRIYVANGCFYCHSQQVRADYAGSDIDRKWGERRSAPRDYIFERPVELGKMRMGPDLSNIGHRAPAEEQNAPPQTSPAPPNAAPGTPGGSPAATASPAAGGSPAAATPSTSPAAPSQPAGSQSNSAVPAAPANVPANPGPKPAGAPAPSQANAPSAPPPQASPAQSAANAAVAGSSPALQQAVAAVAGAATSLEPSPSNVPPRYSATWHHLHLYSPRSLNLDSGMPAYKFLYSKRRISGQPSAEALKLHGDDAPGEGWEVVPTYDAECLVAYLMSLDQSHPLKEVKSIAAPPSPPAPGKAPQ